jgi:hypothetical protein
VLCFAALNAVDLESEAGQRQAFDAIRATGATKYDHKELTTFILG